MGGGTHQRATARDLEVLLNTLDTKRMLQPAVRFLRIEAHCDRNRAMALASYCRVHRDTLSCTADRFTQLLDRQIPSRRLSDDYVVAQTTRAPVLPLR